MLKRVRHREAGLSLIEMMIGIVVGTIVIGGVIAVYVTSIKGSTYTLRTAKVNEELRAVIDVMANDIRRASHSDTTALPTNPFAVRDYGTPANHKVVSIYDQDADGVGDCIVFSYDATYKAGNTAGTPDANADYFAFRQNGDEIQMLNGTKSDTSDCTSGNWEGVTDSDTVVVDALTFSTGQTDGGGNFVGSRCLNISPTPRVSWVSKAGSLLPACEDTLASGYTAPTTGNILLETRQILITITGHHKSDAATTITLQEAVKIMNDRLVKF
jgi:Tfp pilus assembly protein PilW